MTRPELLRISKPILFNTKMVRAILDGRKTVTRRVVKPQPTKPRWNTIGWVGWDDGHGYRMKQPYKPDDILCVRETWRVEKANRYRAEALIYYQAGGASTIRFPNGNTDNPNRVEYDDFITKWHTDGKWHPSIHMPKEAARIFMRVTDVRVERLQDITVDDCDAEGVELCRSPLDGSLQYDPALDFMRIWDSTIKSSDRDKYGWDANPYVWVISFERAEV